MINDTSFIPPQPLETAVLFLVFNRLSTTKQVFETIRQAKPPRLYIASDGARKTKPDEEEIVKSVRIFITQSIDWDCEVKMLFRDTNLGCKYAVSSAITWFFEHEKMGIILEDDCLPSPSFYGFCEELLEKYKDDMSVWHIGGSNFQEDNMRGDASYYFSCYSHVWGWASWANRWQSYHVELDQIQDDSFIKSTFNDRKIYDYWSKTFIKVKNKEIDTWDYQWTFTLWHNNGLSIIPNVNMISNIGFGKDATHTTSLNDKNSKKIRGNILNIIHPDTFERCIEADNYTNNSFVQQPLYKRVWKKIKMMFET
ncbi:nucleotide-diphospho-sugar transferase [Deltaproteobacteria bacterium TL4]